MAQTGQVQYWYLGAHKIIHYSNQRRRKVSAIHLERPSSGSRKHHYPLCYSLTGLQQREPQLTRVHAEQYVGPRQHQQPCERWHYQYQKPHLEYYTVKKNIFTTRISLHGEFFSLLFCILNKGFYSIMQTLCLPVTNIKLNHVQRTL